MSVTAYLRALIVGAGAGLGASLARAFSGECGVRVAIAARRREPLEAIAGETGAVPLVAEASNAAAVEALFDAAADNTYVLLRRHVLCGLPLAKNGLYRS